MKINQVTETLFPTWNSIKARENDFADEILWSHEWIDMAFFHNINKELNYLNCIRTELSFSLAQH